MRACLLQNRFSKIERQRCLPVDDSAYRASSISFQSVPFRDQRWRRSVHGGTLAAARPTMNDAAPSAAVSLKTVSRVVNAETTVDPALAARVREAVAALRYRPNPGASMLRRNDHRTRII